MIYKSSTETARFQDRNKGFVFTGWEEEGSVRFGDKVSRFERGFLKCNCEICRRRCIAD